MCVNSIKNHSFSVSSTITQRNIINLYLGSIVNSILDPSVSRPDPAESVPTKTELLQRFRWTSRRTSQVKLIDWWYIILSNEVGHVFKMVYLYQVLYKDIFLSQNFRFIASFFEWWIRAKHERGIPKGNLLINVYPGPW